MIHKRGCERVYPKKQHATWRHADGGASERADVHDLSASGVGLAVPGRVAARHGEEITVVVDSSQAPKLARIVRIESLPDGDDLRTTLGCRWIAHAPHAHRRESHRPQTRRAR